MTIVVVVVVMVVVVVFSKCQDTVSLVLRVPLEE